MIFHYVSSLDELCPGSYNIMEPDASLHAFTPETAESANVVCIVPAVVFDKKGYRIGYGGGYYDRFLAEEPNHPTIGLCFDFQLVPQLEPEVHDIPAQTVFSL